MTGHGLIAGHSGCNVQPIHVGDGMQIRKVSGSVDYNERLRQQCLRQSSFDPGRFNDIFSVPRVYGEGVTDDGLYYFDMEYVHHIDILTFLSRASIAEVNWFTDHIKMFLACANDGSETDATGYVLKKSNDNFQFLSHQKPAANVFSDHTELLARLEAYFRSIDFGITIAGGYSHNDFTFSNILFVPHPHPKLYLVDFLDSQMESPIMDRVKLAQDIEHGWTFLFIGNRWIDRRKVEVIMSHMMRKLDHELEHSYEFLIFQILNFLSNLKYATRPEVEQLIINAISPLFEELNASHSSHGRQVKPLPGSAT